MDQGRTLQPGGAGRTCRQPLAFRRPPSNAPARKFLNVLLTLRREGIVTAERDDYFRAGFCTTVRRPSGRVARVRPSVSKYTVRIYTFRANRKSASPDKERWCKTPSAAGSSLSTFRTLLTCAFLLRPLGEQILEIPIQQQNHHFLPLFPLHKSVVKDLLPWPDRLPIGNLQIWCALQPRNGPGRREGTIYISIVYHISGKTSSAKRKDAMQTPCILGLASRKKLSSRAHRHVRRRSTPAATRGTTTSCAWSKNCRRAGPSIAGGSFYPGAKDRTHHGPRDEMPHGDRVEYIEEPSCRGNNAKLEFKRFPLAERRFGSYTQFGNWSSP